MSRFGHQGPGIGLNAGEAFAGYTIVRFLGSGGMGEVYLAQHPRLPRHEALKILGSDVSAEDDYRRRFTREADLAAALWHPNIVRINDRGEFDEKLWISMDFVDGTDAASLLRDRYPVGMPADQVAAICAAIADALDYAHQHHDVMHRDVSPANILLSRPDEGGQRILLSDFGIARNIGDSSGLTATNMTVGTFPYAAPEQLADERIDGRADQYALAATLYHLLTGSTLFPHTSPAVVISRHLTAPPPTLAEIRPTLKAFDPVFAVALAKDPSDRFARCEDFAHAFARAARAGTHPTGSACTMPTPVTTRPPNSAAVALAAATANNHRRSRWRGLAAAVTVIALTAVGASAYALDKNGTSPAGPPAASTTLALPQQTVEDPPALALPPASPPAALPPRVAEQAPPPAPPPQRSTPAPKAAPPPVYRAPAPVQAPPPPPPGPAPSPDQTFLGLVSEIPGLTITDPATAAASGRAVCADLQNGGSPHDHAAATINNNTGITPAQAAAGVDAAITAYCPHHLR